MRYLIFLLLLSGCAEQPFWHPVEGWKLLKEPTVYRVKNAGTWCQRGDEDACAIRHPLDGTCTIFISETAPNQECLIKHEIKHCEGFDHPNYAYTNTGCF